MSSNNIRSNFLNALLWRQPKENKEDLYIRKYEDSIKSSDELVNTLFAPASAPPLYQSQDPLDSTPKNIELDFYISIRYKKIMEKSDLLDASRNLKRDFRGNLLMRDLADFLIKSTIESLFNRKSVPSTGNRDDDYIERRYENSVACMLNGITECKPIPSGDTYRGSFKWITQYKGHIYVVVQLNYKLTETPGIMLKDMIRN